MGIFFSSFNRWLVRLVLFGLFLGLSTPGSPSDFQKDPLYEKVNRNTWIRKADSLFTYPEDYAQAARYYTTAIRNLKPDDTELLAYCNIKLSNVYTSLEEFDQVIPFLRKAARILEKLDRPNSLLQAEYELYLGKYLLRGPKYLDSAYHQIQRSIELKRKYHSPDYLSLAESLFFMAEYYKDKQMLHKSEETLREAMLIYETHVPDDEVLLGRIYSTLSGCLRAQFDFKNALDYGARAIQILNRDSVNNFSRLVKATTFYANTYTLQEDYQSSIPIYQKILKSIQKKEGMQNDIYLANVNLATAYTNTNQFDKAIDCLKVCDQILYKYYPDDLYDKAIVLLLYGECYLRSNNLITAQKYLFSSAKIYLEKVSYATDYHSTCEELIGDLYYKRDLLDSSLYYYQHALNIYLDNFSNENIYVNPESQDDPDKREIFDILYKKAKAWRKYYDLEGNPDYLREALNIYSIIERLNDQARNSNLKDASLLIISDFYHDGYEMAIDCSIELFNQTRDSSYLASTFRFMERSKSMLLFKSLVLAERDKSINIPYSVKEHEDSLRMLNLDYDQRLRQAENQETPDRQLIDKLEENKFRVVKAMDNLKIKISTEYPGYYNIRYDSLTKTLNDFKSYCRTRNLLGIEYFWGDSNIYQMYTDGKNSGVSKVKQSKGFKTSLKNLLGQLSTGINRNFPQADFKAFNQHSYEVYQALLETPLESVDHFSGLLIIPDGLLSQLPFEALTTEPGDTTSVDYSRLPYLINNTTIQYAYSMNLVLGIETEKKNPEKDLLAFSYSGLNAVAENNHRSADVMELPYAALELQAIKKVFPGKNKYYYDQNATEYQFKRNAPEYEMLHLAVHGYADTTEGDQSKLVFKQGNDTLNDGTLFMYELYGMDLSRTRLAVLSACQTGIGREFRGEGIFSMARGFFYAGCPAIIMSLWPVGDVHTAEIMQEFYRNLKKRRMASMALRESKIKYIKNQGRYLSHPFNWASFVYLGEEFTYQRDINWTSWIVIGLSTVILITGLLVIFFYRKKIPPLIHS